MNRLTTCLAAAGLSITLLSGCKRDIQNNDAVRKGVLAYFAKRSDLLAMDISVTNVVYNANQATATVHLQAKGNSAPGSGMDMRYVLERNGNDWVVKGRAGGDTHGAQGMPPSTGTPQPGASGGSIGAMPQTLPPGHPSVGGKQPGQSK